MIKIKLNKLEKTLLGTYLAGTATYLAIKYGFDNENLALYIGAFPAIVGASVFSGYRWRRHDEIIEIEEERINSQFPFQNISETK
mgnify:CR=1 FL=1